jgi:hypothetical protein
VQEGGLYNGEFRMIQDTPLDTKKGLSSWQDLAGKAPEESPLDALNSDEWWRKFSAGTETAENDAAGEKLDPVSGADGSAGA